MAWKLRKDKLKADAPEAEETTPVEPTTSEPPAEETEQTPVFDLSGSAFQPEPSGASDEEPDLPTFLDHDQPVSLPGGSALVAEPEREPIELEPLATELAPPAAEPAAVEPVAEEPAAEPSFLAEPLPEFDPIVAPDPETEMEAITIVPPAFSPETESVDQQVQSLDNNQAGDTYPDLSPAREAIASGLVSTETADGLPKVAPFILDTLPAPTPEAEPPRMHSVVIRIGKLSATQFLTKDVTTIGRPDSVVQNYPDIEIELDDGISRRHAEIRHTGSDYAIVDVGSTNGTRLNGEGLTPNQPAVLQPGDRIRVGERTELLFE